MFACIPIFFPPYWMVEEGKLMWPFTVPNLKVISGLIVFCWKKEKVTVTDGTPLKMYTKW